MRFLYAAPDLFRRRLLNEHGQGRESESTLSDAQIRKRMRGNICRCGAYPNIVAAIRVVAARRLGSE